MQTSDSGYYCLPVDIVVEYGGTAGDRSLRVTVNGTELVPQPTATSTGWNDQDNLTPPLFTTNNWWLGKIDHTSFGGKHYFNGELGGIRFAQFDVGGANQVATNIIVSSTDEDPGVGYDGSNACPVELTVTEGNEFSFGPVTCADRTKNCTADIYADSTTMMGQADLNEVLEVSFDIRRDTARNWYDFDFSFFRVAKADLISTLSLAAGESAEVTVATAIDNLLEGEETLPGASY